VGADLSWDLEEYKYDPQNDILTSAEFERILSSDGPTEGKVVKLSDNKPPKSISIVQCVPPSQKEISLFDTIALKYINCIKVKSPDTDVNVFYETSKVLEDSDFMITSRDPRFHYVENLKISDKYNQNCIIADSQEYKSDMIILNANFTPNKDLKDLRKKMDFTLEDSGYMSEDTLASGIYGAGTILGSLDYNSTISTANNVALKIINLLSQDYLIAEFSGIEINEEKCGLCGLCSQSCPYNALIIENDKINIDKFKCKGCGTCVSVCPTNALEMNIDNSEKVHKTVEVLSKFKKHPKIIAFCCHSCGYAAADDAGLKKISYNQNIFIVKVPCTGRVDTDFIIRSFEAGFDGVMIIGCRQDACRYIDGVQKAQKRVNLLKDILPTKYQKRIILKNLNAVEGVKFAGSVNEFYKELEEEIKYED
ncbi:MAG: hydrogenase iron-sulfur subunit, partial [Promethearchaeia archaeon]